MTDNSLLRIEPRPLFFASRKLVLAWSPKSACSHVVVWFFLRQRLLSAANFYHGWPHKFRAEVYYRSEAYTKAAETFLADEARGHTLLRVTRDPAKRLVSIFRHLCRHAFQRNELSAVLGFDVARDGLSLVDLERFLEGRSLTVPSETNFHVCAQYHPIWDMPFDRVLTIDMDATDLNAGLNRVAAEFRLSHTDFAAVPKFDALRRTHYATDGPYEGPGPIEEHRFLPADTECFPKKTLEASPFVRDMAQRLYSVDYRHLARDKAAPNAPRAVA
jgi:hypothetical protein